MFYFWREATAALVPGFLCQSVRRRPENVSILSSLMAAYDSQSLEHKGQMHVSNTCHLNLIS